MTKVRTKISSKNNPKFKRAAIIFKSNYRISTSKKAICMNKKWCTNTECYEENGITEKCFSCTHKIYVRRY